MHDAFRPQKLIKVSVALTVAREGKGVGAIILTGGMGQGVLLRRAPGLARSERIYAPFPPSNERTRPTCPNRAL